MSELQNVTIKVLLTIEVQNASEEVIENIKDGLAGGDRRWNDRGDFVTLNEEFMAWFMDRLAPDWNDEPGWYDEEWSAKALFEVEK